MTEQSRASGVASRPDAHGLTLIELLIALSLVLFVAITALSFLQWERMLSRHQTALADAQSVGRAMLELMSSELRVAGYDPLGVEFDALAEGTSTRVRILQDKDGDGVVGVAGELDENLTYQFSATADGLYTLWRGVDLNGDGDFNDANESAESLTDHVIKIDFDDDGTMDDLLSYDAAPADALRVRLTYGIRSDFRRSQSEPWEVVEFRADVALRNLLYK